MKIELVREEIFTANANGKSIPGLKFVAEWEGFKKFQNSRGLYLILSPNRSPVEEAFDSILGKKTESYTLVKGSVDLFNELSQVAGVDIPSDEAPK